MTRNALNIAYIGGGSMGWARTFMTDLALEPELCGEVRLYDIDPKTAEDNAVIGNRLSSDPRAKAKWRYVAEPDLQKALTGADFVIISILPGTFEHMRSDVHLPERLGVYQPVGDTVGPGGAVRALRTIPLFVGFAEAVRAHAPEAWVINYTNPMGQCVEALYRAYPQIKAFGCCHEVFGTQELLAAMAESEFGARAARGDIYVNVTGINHFTWFDRASYKGSDLIGLFASFADKYYEQGFTCRKSPAPDRVFTCAHRVKFDLYRRYGYIAAAGDRHLAEFMPGDMYLKDPAAAERWGFCLTSVDWRVADRARKTEKTARLVGGDERLALEPSGEEGILLIRALCGLTRAVTNVNLPNAWGQIDGLPRDVVVETNALFSRDDIRPVAAGALPAPLATLVTPHAENRAAIMRAATDCDMDALTEVFLRDRLLAGRCDEKDIRSLARDMVRATMDVLPKGWEGQC
ncbi:MAG: alpha-glucosidase/alpha-galactosidase [Oscillospiraceae bacterium]|jgi:alpha-galactosidase|nr:alpha-glucosidase/alpha-galactosidase [Oscillospiraceae bacterium]